MKYKKAGMVLTAAILALGMGGSFTGCGEKPVDYKPIDMLEESPAQIPDGFLTPEEIPAVEPPDDDKDPWLPDIIDRDEPNDDFSGDFDDSQQYVYQRETVTLAKVSGGISMGEEGAGGLQNCVTTETNSMAVSTTESAPFPYGTITCSVRTKTKEDLIKGIVNGHPEALFPPLGQELDVGQLMIQAASRGSQHIHKDTAGLQGVPEGQLRIRLILLRFMDLKFDVRLVLIFFQNLFIHRVQIADHRIRRNMQRAQNLQPRICRNYIVIRAL